MRDSGTDRQWHGDRHRKRVARRGRGAERESETDRRVDHNINYYLQLTEPIL